MCYAKSQATAIALLTATSNGRTSDMQSLLQWMDLIMPHVAPAAMPNGPYKLLNQLTRGSFAVNKTVKQTDYKGQFMFIERIHFIIKCICRNICILHLAHSTTLCLSLLEQQWIVVSAQFLSLSKFLKWFYFVRRSRDILIPTRWKKQTVKYTGPCWLTSVSNYNNLVGHLQVLSRYCFLRILGKDVFKYRYFCDHSSCIPVRPHIIENGII